MFHKFLVKRVRALMASRPPDFTIGSSKDNPCMLRWWWIPRNRFFNIYVHKILHDDEDRALHDHPWASLSLLIEGELIEHFRRPKQTCTHSRLIKTRRWVYRSPRFAHRLVLFTETALTIFMTGPHVRDWGFHCPKGWVPWRDFVAPDDKDIVGRGCGED